MPVRPPLPPAAHHPVVIAHRGDHVTLPENTLAAYASAIRLGADYIETDLRMTADSQLVISHGEQWHGMDIRSSSWAQLCQKGQIPGFRDVLRLCRQKVNIYLDFKEADVVAAYKLIKEFKMEKRVVVYANAEAQLWQWREVAPTMPLMCSVPDTVRDAASLAGFLDQFPVSAIDGSRGQYTKEMLALCKQRGVAVWLDVQSKDEGPPQWRQALAEGVAGMQTDHPAALIRFLRN